MDKKVSCYDTNMLVAYIILVLAVRGILPCSRVNVTSPYVRIQFKRGFAINGTVPFVKQCLLKCAVGAVDLRNEKIQ